MSTTLDSESILASLDRHFGIHAGLSTSQLREHQERGSCISCDLTATAERNSRWVAADRPYLTRGNAGASA